MNRRLPPPITLIEALFLVVMVTLASWGTVWLFALLLRAVRVAEGPH